MIEFKFEPSNLRTITNKLNLEARLLQVALDPDGFDFFYLFEMGII
jgi:hypothetical protein